MNDVATWKLRGPVRSLRIEIAEWDAERATWKPPRYFNDVTFEAGGKISANNFHNPDGSIVRTAYRYDGAGRLLEVECRQADRSISKSVYAYDDAGRHVRTVSVAPDGSTRETESCRYDSTGRKTKVRFIDAPVAVVGERHFAIEGTEQGISAPGATTMTTTYDDRDLPQEVLLHDANHALVRRVTFARDREGRVLSEDVQFGSALPFDLPAQGTGERSPQEVENLAAMFAQVFDRQTLFRTTYAYDQHGRLLERSMATGTLGEHRTTFRYDDRDNPIEESSDDQQREFATDADGVLRTQKETVHRHITRFEYQYDREGNWTERIVSGRMEATPTFQRSNVERRQITYY